MVRFWHRTTLESAKSDNRIQYLVVEISQNALFCCRHPSGWRELKSSTLKDFGIQEEGRHPSGWRELKSETLICVP